jgi:hypothetical protein
MGGRPGPRITCQPSGRMQRGADELCTKPNCRSKRGLWPNSSRLRALAKFSISLIRMVATSTSKMWPMGSPTCAGMRGSAGTSIPSQSSLLVSDVVREYRFEALLHDAAAIGDVTRPLLKQLLADDRHWC